MSVLENLHLLNNTQGCNLFKLRGGDLKHISFLIVCLFEEEEEGGGGVVIAFSVSELTNIN